MKQRPLVQHLVFVLALSAAVLLAACTAAPAPAPTAMPTVGLPNVVNYAERKPGEPFTVAPSVGVSNLGRGVTAKPSAVAFVVEEDEAAEPADVGFSCG